MPLIKMRMNWWSGLVESSLTGSQGQVCGVSDNVSNTYASPTKFICQRSRVRWRANQSLRFRRSYRGGSVDGLLTTTSNHRLRASVPMRRRRLCQARELNLPCWIAFYAITKLHANWFVALV